MDVLAHLIAWLIAPLSGFLQAGEKMYWMHVLGSVLIAMLVLLRAGVRAPLREIFAREVWGHPSARVDLRWYFVNGMLFAAMLLPILAVQRSFAGLVAEGLGALGGARGAVRAPGAWVGVLMSLAAVVVNDLAVFLPHYAQHRIPLLWQFHKVHHSAEVLTPFTAYRFHPVDDLLNVASVTLIAGAFDGFLLWLYPFELVRLTLYGTNALLFVFYFLGVHLRHSHVWLAYPPALSRILISPAMHQLHHSTDPAHYDKNLGLVFSLWDRVFGTLFIPHGKPAISYGLGGGEERQFDSVRRLYWLPFRKAGALLRREDPAA